MPGSPTPRAGLHGDARTELAAAAQMFSDCGARSLLAATVREQRRLASGSRARRGPGTAGRHGLTQRELEVVKLVREGYTNQQIAESLFVSIRTVETHLSHAFAKLGVSSRTGLLKALSEGRDRPGRPARALSGPGGAGKSGFTTMRPGRPGRHCG